MTRPPATLHRIRRMLAVAMAVSWIGAFVATHLPKEHLPEDIRVGDVALHAAGYFLLGALLLATRAAYGSAWPRRAVVVVLVLAAYAAFDEITQPLVNRAAALSDWLADTGGALGAVILGEAILAMLRRKPKPAPDK